jgi:hypothetical protein
VNTPLDVHIPQWQLDRFAVLIDACGGLPLSTAERRTLLWLAGWEPRTVENVAAIIRRARGDAA